MTPEVGPTLATRPPTSGHAPGALPVHPDTGAPGLDVASASGRADATNGVAGGEPATPALVIEVLGTPAPQGSKRHVGNGVMVESSKKVKPWRESVKWAALESMDVFYVDPEPLLGPVAVNILFRFARPKFHFRTGANAHLLRDNAPTFPSGRPDLDKCVRSTCDALGEAGVFRDDAQIVHIEAWKTYADHAPPGALITVWKAL